MYCFLSIYNLAVAIIGVANYKKKKIDGGEVGTTPCARLGFLTADDFADV